MSADARNQGGDAATRAQAQPGHAGERLFRHLAESSRDGVWTLAPSGVTTFVNAVLARMLGYAPEQLLGRPLAALMDEPGRTFTRQNLARRDPRECEVREFALRHADGRAVWAVITMQPLIGDDGTPEGVLALVTDVGARHGAAPAGEDVSAQLLESQKTESLGVLAGGIAHDFNNLLAAIMGHVEIASGEAGLTLRARTALANALAAAQRAAGLTRQLLDYAGRSKLEVTPLRLGAQCAELVELLRASIPKRVGIELSVPDPSLSIMADPDRLQQATMNLILNAAEAYGGEAGTVSVRVDREQVGPAGVPGMRVPSEPIKPGDYVYLEVRDQGSGMDGATLRRVFEPFFTTKTSGRGLGLAATLGIVRIHGGQLTVRSKVGEGTTFRAYFPRAREAEDAAAAQVASAPPSVRARTLLVVDDEPMVREFAQRLLESEGYGVLEAGSGREALALLRTRLSEIDGVLLDVSMPGMDGDALLSELRSFAPTLPVIVHSGHSLDRTSERLRKWDIAGVLQKPYRAARLSEMVRGLFGEPPTR